MEGQRRSGKVDLLLSPPCFKLAWIAKHVHTFDTAARTHNTPTHICILLPLTSSSTANHPCTLPTHPHAAPGSISSLFSPQMSRACSSTPQCSA